MRSGGQSRRSTGGSGARSVVWLLYCVILKSVGSVRSLVSQTRSLLCEVAETHTVDMSVPYNKTPDIDSEFASMRDSFYILMNLNQYKMKPVISMSREAEGLLRIVLFNGDLKLVGKKKTLSQMRYRLAQDLRSNRRRGVVPIFISTLWFLVALGISIEAGTFLKLTSAISLTYLLAFSDIGSNLQAYNLAMGLFISWLPILVREARAALLLGQVDHGFTWL
jgi:hypothetical protein